MSWLFGMNKQQPPPMPPDFGAPSGASQGESGDNKGGKGGGGQPFVDQGSRMAYSFDSTALERAAKAARELEKFSNAKEALELSRLQEITKQKEVEAQTKQLEAQIQAMKSEQVRIAEEERRKSLIEETKHARTRADYQDQLARKRGEEELAMKARMQEESLRKQEESVKKQEALRKATIEHELALKHKYDLEKVEAETRARAKAARENRDVNLEQLRASEEERRKTVIEQIKTGGAVIGAGVEQFLSDRTKIVSAVGAITALAVGWYAAKQGTSVVARYVEARLGKPSLVRDTSRVTSLETMKHPIKTVKTVFRKAGDPLKGVILSPALESRLRDIAITTKNTKRNFGLFRNVLFYGPPGTGKTLFAKPALESRLRDIAITTKNTKRNFGLFRNVLFYGPPGTGKTLFAKSLARHSGLDYAILTGGDVAPMGRDGVSAMHKVFDWAESSRKGLILFIDEADAFLRKRATEQISEDMRATLNAFLYRTGEQSRKFMLVVASNQPEQFDWAVNDRLDELVEFTLPGVMERERILLQYFYQFIAEPATSGSRKQRLKMANFNWSEKCHEIALKTEGMSGRELSKLVLGWQIRHNSCASVMERERILLQYFYQFIAEPATSGSRKQRLKMANFNWSEKCHEIALKTEGMSGRELSKLVLGWQASAYASEDGVLTTDMIDRNTAEAMVQHGRKMQWMEKEQLQIRHHGHQARTAKDDSVPPPKKRETPV
ncbi:ATPase family AAA domain-containing protein 3-B [Toxocara canis]|uniref:ATPase family AAA domain-containing protein 3-B n=1 Tax=Toxocara canis TaxID=6265 RepID=A0A0B2VEV5_TOXCA|nr:ATPase family AAA domain-containing protein 3-B [Toxocara canis]